MYRALAEWLAGSQLSEYLQAHFWVIPTLQIFHILMVAAVVASVWMLSLRLLGVAGTKHSIESMAQRFLPWMWSALVVLAISGTLLTISEPLDSLLKPMMQLKMALLLVGIVLTAAFQRGVRMGVYAGAPSVGTKVLGGASLAVWLAIVAAGRLIAYVV